MLYLVSHETNVLRLFCDHIDESPICAIIIQYVISGGNNEI